MVTWGSYANFQGSGNSVSVWDLAAGKQKSAWVKASDDRGSYMRGCVLNESQMFCSQYYDPHQFVIYNYEQGFVDRIICQVHGNYAPNFILPRNRTPTGPNTAISSTNDGAVNIWDCREELTAPSSSMPTGISGYASALSYHPSNPDLIAVNCAGKEIRVLSIKMPGPAVHTFTPKNEYFRGVGMYGDTIVCGGSSVVEFFKMGKGSKPLGGLEGSPGGHMNLHLFHDKGVFAYADSDLGAFKY